MKLWHGASFIPHKKSVQAVVQQTHHAHCYRRDVQTPSGLNEAAGRNDLYESFRNLDVRSHQA
jgi:hypothetical protein